MKTITIIGASGHGKVIADIAKLNGYDRIVFFDDDDSVKDCNGYPVAGNTEKEPEGDFVIAIGNAAIRKRITEKYRNKSQPVLIHPNAVVAEDVKIGRGTVVMAGAIINPATVIGNGCIINTGATVDHDCVLGDYCHVAVGAHLCGTVKVGNEVWVGAGSVISNNTNVCDQALIGAGAVVVKDIKQKGTYIGVPAKLKK